MKAKTISKRVLSVVLCTVMLFSCWVFTAPSASALSQSTAGTYDVRIKFKCTNAGDDWDNGYSYDGGNRKNDSKNMVGVTLFYKGNNGTGTESHSDYDLRYYMDNETKQDHYLEFKNVGFPTSVYAYIDHGGWTDDAVYHLYTLEVTKSGSSTYTTLWSGEFYLESTSKWYDAQLWSDGSYHNDSGSYGYVSDAAAWNSKFPYLNSASVTYNRQVNVPENTSAPTSWYVRDQYGVNLGGATITFTGVSGHDYDVNNVARGTTSGYSWEGHTADTTAYSFNTSTGTFTGVKGNGYRNHDMQASYSYAWNNSTGTGNSTWTTLCFPDKYTATYKYYTTKTSAITTSSSDAADKEYMSVGTATTTNTVAASDSYKAWYGDAAGVPATSAYTNHYYTSAGHFYNGAYQAPTLTANATKYLSYKNGGSSYVTSMASHSWSQNWAKYTGTSEGLSGTEFHRKTCTVGGDTHYKYQKHQWNNGVINPNPTCTTKGIKTYTCACGATKTEDVDIVSTNHSWGSWVDYGDDTNHKSVCQYNSAHEKTQAHTYGTTTFAFANDGKSATASRTCTVSTCHHTQSATLTLNNGITSAIKTPATCTEKGWTTYTATSPFNDGATGTKDVQDIPATGHHLADNPIMYKDADGHYYKCKDCDAFIKSDLSEGKHAHTPKAAQRENVVSATCTTAGSYNSVVRCSECDWAISSTPQTIDPLGHDWGLWTDYDNATQHKRVCSRDANHIEYDNHNWSGWQHVVPTEEETGVRATVRQKLADAQYNEETSHYNYCTDCGYTKIESHPPVEQWTIDQEHTYPATCEAAGQTTSKCPDCGKTKVETIKAKGHTWVRWDGCNEEKISELSGAVPVILKCKNGCNKFCSSYYDEKTHKYESTGNAGDYEYVIGRDTASIPTPSFNEHFEYFDGQIMEPYHYRERKASLRVRPSEKEDDTQAIRFSGNLTAGNIVDAGVKFNFNPKLIIKNYTEDMPAKDAKLMSLEEIRNNRDAYDDKTVIDFGFVFTQARFIRSAKETIDYDLMTLDNIGTNYRIYRMSVVGNNLDNFRDDKTIENWKGLTMIGEEATFNLVIDVNKKNYQATYVARTYVIYKYHGDIICVYDQPYENYEWDNEKGENVPNHYYSHDSVYNQAHKVLTLTEPTDFVKSYLEDKIINNTATQNFVDWNVNYTLKDFPKVEED